MLLPGSDLIQPVLLPHQTARAPSVGKAAGEVERHEAVIVEELVAEIRLALPVRPFGEVTGPSHAPPVQKIAAVFFA